MTRAHATALQLDCEHLSQVAPLVVLNEDGYVTSTYHCRDCGVAIVRTYKAPTFSGMSLDRVIRYQNTSQA